MWASQVEASSWPVALGIVTRDHVAGTIFATGSAIASGIMPLDFRRDFVGHEAALVRVLGMAAAVIGWLYFFGGRSGGRQVVAASVMDRIILVPLVLVPLALAGLFPHLLMTFAILDPLLGRGG